VPKGVTSSLQELIRLRAIARSFDLSARRIVRSNQGSGYRSSYRGRGLEFDEVRAYASGDDARTIDWRVTARRGQPHTKLFREERERPVFILADLHPGTFFGTRQVFKSVLMAKLVALTAWAAEQGGDRVGGVVSSKEGHSELPPKARKAGVLALLHAIVERQPLELGELQVGRLDAAMARLARVTHPGSLVFLFSDFREMGAEFERHLAALSRHSDVLAGFIFDPLESEPPPVGRYSLGVPGQCRVMDAGHAKVRQDWRDGFQTHRENLEKVCRRHGVRSMELETSRDPLKSLLRGYGAA
jgi:uncharacterized protein (DUF58 family)